MRIQITRDTSKRDAMIARKQRMAVLLAAKPFVEVYCTDTGKREAARNAIAIRALNKGGHAPKVNAWHRGGKRAGERVTLAELGKRARKPYHATAKAEGTWVTYSRGPIKPKIKIGKQDTKDIIAEVEPMRRELAAVNSPATLRAFLMAVGQKMVARLRQRIPHKTGQVVESLAIRVGLGE